MPECNSYSFPKPLLAHICDLCGLNAYNKHVYAHFLNAVLRSVCARVCLVTSEKLSVCQAAHVEKSRSCCTCLWACCKVSWGGHLRGRLLASWCIHRLRIHMHALVRLCCWKCILTLAWLQCGFALGYSCFQAIIIGLISEQWERKRELRLYCFVLQYGEKKEVDHSPTDTNKNWQHATTEKRWLTLWVAAILCRHLPIMTSHHFFGLSWKTLWWRREEFYFSVLVLIAVKLIALLQPTTRGLSRFRALTHKPFA